VALDVVDARGAGEREAGDHSSGDHLVGSSVEWEGVVDALGQASWRMSFCSCLFSVHLRRRSLDVSWHVFPSFGVVAHAAVSSIQELF
jgi:hypothetical protein